MNTNKGSVLAISLVILTAITLISIVSLERSGLQSKIVRSLQHSEMIFNSSLNEQEYWLTELKNTVSGDLLLSDPIYNFSLDAENNQTYLPVELTVASDASTAINLSSGLLYVPNEEGRFALSEGEEANMRTIYNLELTSISDIAFINFLSSQTTGVSFSGLNNNKNSKN